MDLKKHIKGIFFLVLSGAGANAQMYDSLMWVPDAAVHSIVKNGNDIYMGGDFDYVGKPTGYAVPLDTATGVLAFPNFPKIDGPVYAIASDYKGGWYIGGDFDLVGGLNRKNFARIKWDGSVYPITLDPDGPVYAIETSPYPYGQPYVFIGGDFQIIQGVNVHNAAQLNALTQTIMQNWDPNLNGPVYAMKKVGEYCFVGGAFTTVDNFNYRYLAKINISRTYSLDLNSPNPPSGPVYALYYNSKSTSLFLGGVFTFMGTMQRNHIAQINPNTGILTSWNPIVNGNVRAISGLLPPMPIIVHTGNGGGGRQMDPSLQAVSNTLYIGGQFTYVNGNPVKGFAELDILTANVINPSTANVNCDGTVWAIYADKPHNKIYIGGQFKNINGQARYNLACVDTFGIARVWQASVGNKVRAISTTPNVIYMGSESPCMFGREAHHVAFVDATSGVISTWDPMVTGNVNALILKNNILYMGGAFDSIQGVFRKNIGAIDLSTNSVTSFDPQCDGTIRTMHLINNKIYIGGYFNNAGGQARTNIACISLITQLATPWNPLSNGTVNSITSTGDQLYCGGYFTNIGGYTSPRIASLDTVNGYLNTNWDPVPNDGIYSVAIANNDLAVGGWFTSMDGQGRNGICQVGLNTPTLSGINPAPDGIVRAIGTSGNYAFVGGDFANFAGQNRKSFAAYDINNGQLQALNIRLSASPLAFLMDGEELYTGGLFTGVQLDVHAFFLKIHTHYLLGTHELNPLGSNFSAYPSPTTGNFTLEGLLNGSGKDISVSIFNSIGENVLEEKVLHADLLFRKNFDLSAMNAGIYFIRISDGNANYNAKIVKVN